MDIFAKCQGINDLLVSGDEAGARNELIMLLETLRVNGIETDPLVNHLIRSVGLYPYIETDKSFWPERLLYEAFKANIGEDAPVTLHREQSRLLSKLVSGESVAVSAPTSFGKSFVIDSFIAINRPDNVLIIVPTIALADEARRRLHRKFASTYKVITTSDQELSDKNILIFPQERAIRYAGRIEKIDLLVIDEFYKASAAFDKDRAPTLIRAIMELGKIAHQKYYLAPNIGQLQDSPFLRDMELLHLDFNTVFLQKHKLYENIGRDQKKKGKVLSNIIAKAEGKSLVYAGTFSNIAKITDLLLTESASIEKPLLTLFQDWLETYYEPNWSLPKLIGKGAGVHNGRLHRSLTQIQVRLFEEIEGLDCMISTSSIIEGVNTSAENVILWSNKNGQSKIDDFTYRNIIGRSGRMFKHFVGKVFVLEEPPEEEITQLELEMPEELLGLWEEDAYEFDYSPDQRESAKKYRENLIELFGVRGLDGLYGPGGLQNSSRSLTMSIAASLSQNKNEWNGLNYLNSPEPDDWEYLLYRLIRFQPGGWGIEYTKYVNFVKILSQNWNRSIPELLQDLEPHDIGVDKFFELERHTTFKLASLVSDVQTIHNKLYPESGIDLTVAATRFSHAFLPTPVYQLEEYGLPRMISRKLQNSGLIDFEQEGLGVHDAISCLAGFGYDAIGHLVGDLHEFDLYMLRYFFEGIGEIEVEYWTE